MKVDEILTEELSKQEFEDTMHKTLKSLAKKYFKLDDLRSTGTDKTDIHEVAVWNIKYAMTVSFKEGYDLAMKELKKTK